MLRNIRFVTCSYNTNTTLSKSSKINCGNNIYAMFSANENVLLRQHKKRVVEYVESTIPEDVLDLGINVMAMQVSCTSPGCVPIETAIIIIFPKLSNNNNDNNNSSSNKELLPGLPESAIGGSYKTKILKPLAEVTREDVCAALPPSFMGGTKSIEKLCYQIRDNLFAQITQLFDDDIPSTSTTTNEISKNIDITAEATVVLGDNTRNNTLLSSSSSLSSSLTSVTPAPVVGQRQLVAQYIQQCLQEYIDHNCIPPDIGEPYPERKGAYNNSNNDTSEMKIEATQQQRDTRFSIPSTGNVTIPRPMDNDITTTTATTTKSSSNDINDNISASNTTNEAVPDITNVTEQATTSESSLLSSTPRTKPVTISLVNSSAQRRQQAVAVRELQRQMESSSTSNSSTRNSSSRQLLAQIATTSSHSRGIRRPGCPCCDPDSASTIVDQYLSQT